MPLSVAYSDSSAVGGLAAAAVATVVVAPLAAPSPAAAAAAAAVSSSSCFCFASRRANSASAAIGRQQRSSHGDGLSWPLGAVKGRRTPPDAPPRHRRECVTLRRRRRGVAPERGRRDPHPDVSRWPPVTHECERLGVDDAQRRRAPQQHQRAVGRRQERHEARAWWQDTRPVARPRGETKGRRPNRCAVTVGRRRERREARRRRALGRAG